MRLEPKGALKHVVITGHCPRKPARARDQPVSAAAQAQPGRLVAVGPGGAGRGASAPTSRSCSRSATPPATGATSWRTRASRTTATAGVMNELFVNIKVDREERPDIDQIYMSALHHLGEHGGWPLTMFLTPAGEPFWGGTYFPKTARYGKPAFVDVLREVARVFRQEPQSVEQNRSALDGAAWRKARGPQGSVVIGAAELDRAANQIARHDRPGPRRHARRAEIPAADDARVPLARRPAHERQALLRRGRAIARPDVRGRHLRPPRRRLLPLLGRRALAGAAFREDALRQRPAARTARASPTSAPATQLFRSARARDRRLARRAR